MRCPQNSNKKNYCGVQAYNDDVTPGPKRKTS